MNKWPAVALFLIGATILGATVLREPIAYAAQAVDATIIGPLDAGGNVRVHEQGTANAHVANPLDEPVPVRDVENPPARPFQQTLELASTSDTGVEDCASFAVPLRKYLAIEHIAVMLKMDGANQIDDRFPGEAQAAALVKLVTVKTKVGDDLAEYPVPLGGQLQLADIHGDEGQVQVFQKLRLASDQVSIYATSGNVTACVKHGFTSDDYGIPQPNASATVTISGRSFGPGLVLPPLPLP